MFNSSLLKENQVEASGKGRWQNVVFSPRKWDSWPRKRSYSLWTQLLEHSVSQGMKVVQPKSQLQKNQMGIKVYQGASRGGNTAKAFTQQSLRFSPLRLQLQGPKQ